jgi:predicted lipid-binding transport protein (Tim44 family)
MPYYNSLSMLGGFLGPYLAGYLLQRPGGIKLLCIIVGVVLIVAGGAIALLRHLLLRRERAAAAAAAAADGLGADSVDSADATVEAAAAAAVKDIEAPGPPSGAVRKDSGLDFGVEMVQGGGHGSSGADTLVHRRDANQGLLPPRGGR